MTAGNDGASTPEDDDPFGYLYEDGQSGGAGQRRQGGYGYPGPAAQPGVPRTSYNQVRTVGERQYGQQPPQQVPPQGGYGQPQQPGYGQQPYGAPGPQYAAQETQPVGSVRQGPPSHQHGGRGSGPNTRGLLIGAVAVVAAVVIGIAIALGTGDDGDKDKAGDPTSSASGAVSQEPSATPPKHEVKKSGSAPEQDAAGMQLGGSAVVATEVQGAKAKGGSYVSMPGPGASATWTVDVPAKGAYTLSVDYGVPGTDAKMSLFVNAGDARSINMKNFAGAAAGDAAKGWTNTFAYIDLNAGSNTIKISCEQGDQCGVNLDRVKLKAGQGG